MMYLNIVILCNVCGLLCVYDIVFNAAMQFTTFVAARHIYASQYVWLIKKVL